MPSLPLSSTLQSPKLKDHDCGIDELPLNTKHLQTLLLHLDAYKLMGLNGIHPRVLRELVIPSQ